MRTLSAIVIIFFACLFDCHGQMPGLTWVKSIGSSSNDIGYDVATDTAGNIYYTGSFTGTVDFDPGPGIANPTSAGLDDIFISKFDENGNFLWAKTVGSSVHDDSYAIAVDIDGGVYITGEIGDNADMNPGPGVFNITADPLGTAYILKLDASGNFQWAKALLGNETRGYDIALDYTGNIHVTGTFSGTVDFDPGSSVNNMTMGGIFRDGFVLKLNASGNFTWAKKIGGNFADYCLGIAVDSQSNVYTCGDFNTSADMDPGSGVYTLTAANPNYTDGFVCKLNSSGNFVWAAQVGGGGDEKPHSVAVDASSNVIIAGMASSNVDWDPGPAVYSMGVTAYDGFVWKLTSSGGFVWAKSFGSVNSGTLHSVVCDSDKNVYVGGDFNGTGDFDPGPAVLSFTSAGAIDGYIAKLDSTGNLSWVGKFGASSADRVNGLTIDKDNNLLSTGQFSGTVDFDLGPGVHNVTGGNVDAFLQKMGVGSPLSVTILDFNVSLQNGTALLGWRLESDLPIKVSVLRSSNAVEWMELTGFSERVYTGSESVAYDAAPFDKTYYRLKITDIAGKEEYSVIRIIEFKDLEADAKIYPVPASQIVHIDLPRNSGVNYHLAMYDAAGTRVDALCESKYSAVTNTLTLNTSRLQPGIYYMKLSSGERTINRSLQIL